MSLLLKAAGNLPEISPIGINSFDFEHFFMFLVEHLRLFLDNLEVEDIKFKTHFRDRIAARPVTEGLVRDCLKRTDRLINAERQPPRKPQEQKYKLWFKLSNRYSLVVIAVVDRAELHIVTAWNTERKWQKEKKG